MKLVAPVRDQAAAILREAIQSGEISPGTPLIERELCESLDIGRNTLREAYRLLEAEGLLDIRPHRSPMVAVLTEDQARELYEVREALEGEGIKLFTQRATDDDVDRLELASLTLASAIEHGSRRELVAAKDEFYDVVFAGARNEALHHLARLTYSRLAPLRVRSLAAPGRARASAQEVIAVMGSVRARNPEAAEALWRRHVQNAATAAFSQTRTPE